MKSAQAQTAGKTETFFSRNVRLITFLICMAVFLTFFGPVSVFTVKRIIEKANQKPVMTVSEAKDFCEHPQNWTFDDLLGYRGRYSQTEDRETYFIEFGEYTIFATRNKVTGVFAARLYNAENKSADILKGEAADLLQ